MPEEVPLPTQWILNLHIAPRAGDLVLVVNESNPTIEEFIGQDYYAVLYPFESCDLNE